MYITEDVIYTGVNDHSIDLFEGQYSVPNGMAYNSYIIKDEKIAVFDTVDHKFKDEWLKNVVNVLDNKKPEYLIVQHMEPDHSANIINFLNMYPNTIVVSSAKSFVMIKNFFNIDLNVKSLIVADGDKISLGKHVLNFIAAPMVHWPEVMVTYDSTDKVLFSADAFGKFGALDVDENWCDEARRYYIGIVGKYGAQVQNLIKKVSTYDIKTICPLHGPVIKENLSEYIGLYNIWSSYSVESIGVVIAYTSVYGNTKKAVDILEDELKKRGCSNIVIHDLARCDMSKAVEDAFRYGMLVLATTTYNGNIFPFMKDYIDRLTERGFRNRTIGLIENGSWAPQAAKIMHTMLENCKDLTFTDTTVKIMSGVNDETEVQIRKLAEDMI